MSKVDSTLLIRENKYGSFKDNAEVSQGLKSVIFCGKSYNDLSGIQKESLQLICTKISRILGGDPNYIDNWHDIAGYATLVENDIKQK